MQIGTITRKTIEQIGRGELVHVRDVNLNTHTGQRNVDAEWYEAVVDGECKWRRDEAGPCRVWLELDAEES